MLSVRLHLTRWLSVLVNELVLKFFLFTFETQNSRINVLNLLLCKKNFVIALLNFCLECLQVPLVLLLNFPVLKLASNLTSLLSISNSRTDARTDLGTWFGCSIEISGKGLTSLNLSHLVGKRGNFKLSRSRTLWNLCSNLVQFLDFGIWKRYGQLLHGSFELNLIELSFSISVILS